MGSHPPVHTFNARGPSETLSHLKTESHPLGYSFNAHGPSESLETVKTESQPPAYSLNGRSPPNLTGAEIRIARPVGGQQPQRTTRIQYSHGYAPNLPVPPLHAPPPNPLYMQYSAHPGPVYGPVTRTQIQSTYQNSPSQFFPTPGNPMRYQSSRLRRSSPPRFRRAPVGRRANRSFPQKSPNGRLPTVVSVSNLQQGQANAEPNTVTGAGKESEETVESGPEEENDKPVRLLDAGTVPSRMNASNSQYRMGDGTLKNVPTGDAYYDYDPGDGYGKISSDQRLYGLRECCPPECDGAQFDLTRTYTSEAEFAMQKQPRMYSNAFEWGRNDFSDIANFNKGYEKDHPGGITKIFDEKVDSTTNLWDSYVKKELDNPEYWSSFNKDLTSALLQGTSSKPVSDDETFSAKEKYKKA